jgi:hypothetical protein
MFNPDFSDLLRLFTKNRVQYVVVGAYAMAAHGYVRATGDIDLFVQPTRENAAAVYASLVAFGAPLSGITAEDFAVPSNIYQIGVPPNRIDILTAIDGMNYEAAGRVTLEINGLDIPFLDLESLKRNKAASGRAKDKLDLELLRESDEPGR